METQSANGNTAILEAGASDTTVNHATIRRWIEARDGSPAMLKSVNQSDNPGLLRVEFRGYRGSEWLEPISWEAFFQRFEDEQLAFLYQDVVNTGTISRFYQFVSRN